MDSGKKILPDDPDLLKEMIINLQNDYSSLNNKYTDEVAEYRSFWITNMVFVEAVPLVILEMAERSEIAIIDLDAELEWDKPVAQRPAPAKSLDGIEPGLAAINAPAMWALGYTGAGRIVMNDDTARGLPNSTGPKAGKALPE